MGDAFTFFILVLILLAIFTRETFVVVLIYLFIGAGILGKLWVDRVVNRMQYSRKFEHKVFPGEIVPVDLQIQNSTWLPAVWLNIQDYFPIEVADVRHFAQVISLKPREQIKLNYSL